MSLSYLPTNDIKPRTLPSSRDPRVFRDTVAVLTKSVGIVWDQSADFQPILGDTLEAGYCKLKVGLPRLSFFKVLRLF